MKQVNEIICYSDYTYPNFMFLRHQDKIEFLSENNACNQKPLFIYIFFLIIYHLPYKNHNIFFIFIFKCIYER
jgi:hypothetical protein